MIMLNELYYSSPVKIGRIESMSATVRPAPSSHLTARTLPWGGAPNPSSPQRTLSLSSPRRAISPSPFRGGGYSPSPSRGGGYDELDRESSTPPPSYLSSSRPVEGRDGRVPPHKLPTVSATARSLDSTMERKRKTVRLAEPMDDWSV